MKTIKLFILSLVLTLFLFSFDANGQDYRYENILQAPYIFTMKNGFFFSCSNKVSLPIDLPKDAIGFFYEFTVLPAKSKLDKNERLLQKLGEVNNDNSLETIPAFIDSYTSSKYINTYFISGFDNMDKFQTCQYQQHPLGGAVHWTSGVGYFKNPDVEELFIGFENPYGRFKKLKIKVELVAVFSDLAN